MDVVKDETGLLGPVTRTFSNRFWPGGVGRTCPTGARELVVKSQRDDNSMLACEALAVISRLAMLWVDTCFPDA